MARYFEVIDQVYGSVTREADPDDSWSRDSTSEEHCIVGLKEVPEGKYYDVGVTDGPVDELYLLYGIYSTGDSFGTDSGRIEFVSLHRDKAVAEENARRIEKNADDFRRESRHTTSSYSVELLTDEGETFKFCVPWNGHFESLDWITVERVDVKE